MKRPSNGSILVSSLWILTILTLLALGIGFRVSLEMRLMKYYLSREEGRYLAWAGIMKAEDRISKSAKEYDTRYECGIELVKGEALKELFSAEDNKLGKGSFAVCYYDKDEKGADELRWGMADEERRININIEKLAPGNIAEFKRILGGLSPNLKEEVINAVIDWQDTDDAALFPGGAEDFDYEAELGYSCKDKPFEAVEELLLVKGVTIELFSEIEDYITVYGDGKVNINTATKKVIDAIINDRAGTYTALVDRIIKSRDGVDGKGMTGDDQAFKNMDEVKAMAQTVTEESRLDIESGYFAFNSNNFRVVSRGQVNNVTKVVTCVLKKDQASKNTDIAYYHEE